MAPLTEGGGKGLRGDFRGLFAGFSGDRGDFRGELAGLEASSWTDLEAEGGGRVSLSGSAPATSVSRTSGLEKLLFFSFSFSFTSFSLSSSSFFSFSSSIRALSSPLVFFRLSGFGRSVECGLGCL